MTRRQLALLFLCSLVFWTMGNGLLPLLAILLLSLLRRERRAGKTALPF